ncbi:hypothetical protein [Nocardioides dongkuii]|uniref:hypothetical protein n=1 Tax=Nocardioides dongkuii TaxID=2760089 RepID=UPI0015FB1D6B|nr:hypothetical protein [Nocardioides dongkuii]
MPGDTIPDQQTASGLDDEGCLSVTVDGADRVVEVHVVTDAPRLRRPDGLRAAVDEAARAARVARRDAGRPDVAVGSGMPEAVRATHQPVVAVQNWMGTGWRPDPADLVPHHYDTDDLGPTTGVSDNDCVSVTLGLASAGGIVTADPGWLANARTSHLERAVLQAFDQAYRKRDDR